MSFLHRFYVDRTVEERVCPEKPTSTNGATVSVQDGNVPRHMHPNTNEIHYILGGTSTIWLGDKKVHVQPGDLVIISKGTPHAGTKPDGRPFKAIAIKTPPQGPNDSTMLPE